MEPRQPVDFIFPVGLFGNSSALAQFAKGNFEGNDRIPLQNPLNPIGLSYMTRVNTLNDGLRVKLLVWCFSSGVHSNVILDRVMQRFHCPVRLGLYVFNTTDPSAFSTFSLWYKRFRKWCPEGLFILIGDNPGTDPIGLKNLKIAFSLAEYLPATLFFEISTPNGLENNGIHELCDFIARYLVNKAEQAPPWSIEILIEKLRLNLVLDELDLHHPDLNRYYNELMDICRDIHTPASIHLFQELQARFCMHASPEALPLWL
jgi:hypothetical protein